jgi:hypothetical protein
MNLLNWLKCDSETYSKVRIGKYFPISFPILNVLSTRDALTSLVFRFGLLQTIRYFQEYQMGLKLNGTYRLLACADDVNMFRDNMYSVTKNKNTVNYAR